LAESTITAKGQTTVPLQIREAIGAAPGTRLIWHVLPDGALIVRAKNKSLVELAGALEAPPGTHVAVEDMNPWR
jgi:antitoxin PrlF